MSESQSSDGEILFRSEHGIPLVWFVAFGGRNIWNPGDDVEARGGVVGKRNPYETVVEVAATRLEHAESVLAGAPYLRPWLAGMTILRNKLQAKPKTGFIRLVAPWVAGMKDAEVERWRSATAFAENAINLIGAGREPEAIVSLAQLKAFCPLLPGGISSDLDDLRKSRVYTGEEELLRLALLTVGEPDNREPFDKAARRSVGEALQEYHALPPRKSVALPKPVAVAAPATEPAPTPANAKETSKPGLLGRLAGLFGRK